MASTQKTETVGHSKSADSRKSEHPAPSPTTIMSPAAQVALYHVHNPDSEDDGDNQWYEEDWIEDSDGDWTPVRRYPAPSPTAARTSSSPNSFFGYSAEGHKYEIQHHSTFPGSSSSSSGSAAPMKRAKREHTVIANFSEYAVIIPSPRKPKREAYVCPANFRSDNRCYRAEKKLTKIQAHMVENPSHVDGYDISAAGFLKRAREKGERRAQRTRDARTFDHENPLPPTS